MLLLEHQGKDLLRRFGIRVPAGRLVRDETALAEAVSDGRAKVLKAQVATGGRGKAGGILFAAGREEALAAFSALRKEAIAGHLVETVLVEDRIAFECERYMGLQVESGRLRLLLSAKGGIDIEQTAAEDEASMRLVEVDVLDGPDPARLSEAFAGLGLPPTLWPAYADVAAKLFALARTCDAATVEINPLVETAEGSLIALDARVYLDELALPRQPELAALGSKAAASEAPVAAGPRFKSVPEGGSVGLIGFGSGLNITFMDWMASLGGKVGSLVDIDAMVTGGRGEEGFAAAFAHMDRSPDIRAVLLCIISCGNRMDDIVAAMIAAHRRRTGPQKPVILHLRGNRMSFAQPLLDAARLMNSRSLSAAVADVVAAAKEAAS